MHHHRTILASITIIVILTTSPAFAQINSPPNSFIPVTFHISGTDVHSSADTQTLDVMFNPKEYIISKSISWETQRHPEADSPALEFSIGAPARLSVELFFDTYEEKTSVKELTDKVASLSVANPGGHMPNCLVTIGTMQFKCILESFTIKYTQFLDDGTPVKAVMDVVFSEILPSDDRLNHYTLKWKDLLPLLDASQESVPLLNSYDANSLDQIPTKLFGNLQVQKNTYTLSPLSESSQASDLLASSDVKGFKVSIDSAKTTESNSWESVHGGNMIIEVTDTTVGSDKFHTHSPGHKSVSDITLQGPLTRDRQSITDWLNNNPVNCKTCEIVSLSFFDQNEKAIKEYRIPVLDAFYFKNKVFLLDIQQDNKLHATVLDIQRTRADGSVFSGPPRIFVVLPTSSPGFMPVGIGGTNFDVGTIPYFGGVPSIALFNFGTQNIPLIGSIAVGFTMIPPAAPSGQGDVQVEYQTQRSNPFPFTVN